MFNTTSLLENLHCPVVACNGDYIVTYANEPYIQMIRDMMGIDDFVGSHMGSCHTQKSMEKLAQLFDEFRHRKRDLYSYSEDFPTGKLTFVISPLYRKGNFDGAVEFVFTDLSI